MNCPICGSKIVVIKRESGRSVLQCANSDCGFRSEPFYEDAKSNENEEAANALKVESKDASLEDQQSGPVRKSSIYCIDVSQYTERGVTQRIESADALKSLTDLVAYKTHNLKPLLEDLIASPMSYLNAELFFLCIRTLLRNQKCSEFRELVRVVIFSGVSDEILSIMVGSDDRIEEYLAAFLKDIELLRAEYEKDGMLQWRDFKSLMAQLEISLEDMENDLSAEDYEAGGQPTEICILSTGRHQSENRTYFNPIRFVESRFMDIREFRLQYLNLSPTVVAQSLKGLLTKYEGSYVELASMRDFYDFIVLDRWLPEEEFKNNPLLDIDVDLSIEPDVQDENASDARASASKDDNDVISNDIISPRSHQDSEAALIEEDPSIRAVDDKITRDADSALDDLINDIG